MKFQNTCLIAALPLVLNIFRYKCTLSVPRLTFTTLTVINIVDVDILFNLAYSKLVRERHITYFFTKRSSIARILGFVSYLPTVTMHMQNSCAPFLHLRYLMLVFLIRRSLSISFGHRICLGDPAPRFSIVCTNIKKPLVVKYEAVAR